MTIDLEAIEARLAAATSGPWRSSWDDPADEVTGERPWLIKSAALNANPLLGDDVICLVYWDGDNLGCTEPDAALIAHAPTDLRALIDEVRSLRAQVEARPDISPEQAARFLGNAMGIASRVAATDRDMERRLREHARKVKP